MIISSSALMSESIAPSNSPAMLPINSTSANPLTNPTPLSQSHQQHETTISRGCTPEMSVSQDEYEDLYSHDSPGSNFSGPPEMAIVFGEEPTSWKPHIEQSIHPITGQSSSNYHPTGGPAPEIEGSFTSPESAQPQDSPSIETNSKKVKHHPCSICWKLFPRPSALKTHMHTHTNEKPFACNFPGCMKIFSVESNAKRHMRTHDTGEPSMVIQQQSTQPYVVDFETPIVVDNVAESGEGDAGGSKPLRWMPVKTNEADLFQPEG